MTEEKGRRKSPARCAHETCRRRKTDGPYCPDHAEDKRAEPARERYVRSRIVRGGRTFSRQVVAALPGSCGLCGGFIVPGSRVRRQEQPLGRWCHVDCVRRLGR